MPVEIAPDPPDYPPEWTPGQRVTAYWFHLAHPVPLRTVNSWRLVLRAADEAGERHQRKVKRIRDEQAQPIDLDAPPLPPEPPW